MLSIGIDEAGRGPWAGPLFVALVVLDDKGEALLADKGVTDSKKLTPRKREKLFPLITQNSVFYRIESCSASFIDRHGVYQSTKLLIAKLIEFLPSKYLKGEILVDGKFPDLDALIEGGIPVRCIVKGDSEITSIGAASILAKVCRDEEIAKIALKYPQYQFEKHKGYGTKLHRDLLRQFGPCPEHRKSFKPVREVLSMDLFKTL